MAPGALAVWSFFGIYRASCPPECDGRIGGRRYVFLRFRTLDHTVIIGDAQLESDEGQKTNYRGMTHSIPVAPEEKFLVAKSGVATR